MGQKEKLLEYLEAHESGITQMEAFLALGCCRLSQRVIELERDGVGILHEPCSVPTRDGVAHCVRYRLQDKYAVG